MPAGRPSKFDKKMIKQVVKLCRLGAVDEELADFFDVAPSTISNWKIAHPEFMEALKKGKAEADATVANRLFKRATGYTHDDVHISNHQGEITKTDIKKHYPPDTVACIFWLKNRRPELWRDRIEHTGKNGGAIQHEDVTPMEAVRRVAYMFRQADQQEKETTH